MPLSLSDVASPDVLEGHAPEPDNRWPVRSHPLVHGLGVALVAAVALQAVQADTDVAVVDASGSMVVEHHFSEATDRPYSTAHWEEKNAWLSGPIQVDLPDRQLRGFARLTLSFAANVSGGLAWITHTWGHVHARFGSTTCDGPIAWTWYRAPHEAGGSMSLRCDDGSLFAATVLADGDEPPNADHRHRAFFTLEDGSYVAG